jgi:hypothetical protein
MNDNPIDQPFENGASDEYSRDEGGRFKTGTKGGPGNPRAKYARQMSDRILEAGFKTCDPNRLLKAWDAVMAKAETGDIPAMKLILEYVDGPAGMRFTTERIERLEELLAERGEV